MKHFCDITELALGDVDRSTHIPLKINGNMKKTNFPEKRKIVQVNSRKKWGLIRQSEKKYLDELRDVDEYVTSFVRRQKLINRTIFSPQVLNIPPFSVPPHSIYHFQFDLETCRSAKGKTYTTKIEDNLCGDGIKSTFFVCRRKSVISAVNPFRDM